MRLIPWLLTSESDFIECGVDGFGILNSTSLIKYSSFTKHFSQALQFGVIEVLAADLFGRRLFLNINDCLTYDFHLKKMPGRTGRMEAMTTECLPWRVMQGLQRNVIGMALCCKKKCRYQRAATRDESGTDKVTQQLHGRYGLPRS